MKPRSNGRVRRKEITTEKFKVDKMSSLKNPGKKAETALPVASVKSTVLMVGQFAVTLILRLVWTLLSR